MYLRYSLSVVAPMARNSPRASAGFSMLLASIAPSAAPAPTRVCSSSMNRMISPFESSISFSTAFRRSSNSPRNLAPASMSPGQARSLACRAVFPAHRPEKFCVPTLRRSRSCRRPARQSAPDCFCAAAEHLHHAAYLFIAANHGVKLAAARQLRQVLGVFCQRLELALGVLVGHAL